MSRAVDILYPAEADGTELPELIAAAQTAGQALLDVPLADRLSAFDTLSDQLLEGRLRQVPGIAFLAAFLRSTNLRTLIERELTFPDALRQFVPIGERKSARVLPQGLVAHWVAGNVPLLGMFSWALSAVVGNANVIRLSSKQEDVVSPLIELLAQSSAVGRQLAAATLLVCFDREHSDAHVQLSQAADVRIAWGGQEAIETIRALPCRWECEDIALGPRVSYAVIDPTVATDASINRLATDAVYFDQLACSSPQYLFLRDRGEQAEIEGFVERFTAAFERQAVAIPRHPLDFSESYQIELDRTRALLEGGRLARDSQTEWTIALVDRPNDEIRCANRFVQIIPFQRFETVYGCIPRNIQTIITLLGADEAEQFSEQAARRGVCRLPRPGEGNLFETPWDGVPLVARLTRWTLRSDNRR